MTGLKSWWLTAWWTEFTPEPVWIVGVLFLVCVVIAVDVWVGIEVTQPCCKGKDATPNRKVTHG